MISLMGLGILAGCADENSGRCVLSGFGDIPIIMPAGSPIVRGSVNQHPVAFVIDTGMSSSAIDDRYADMLGLIPTGAAFLMHGVDGETTAHMQMADEFTLGQGRGRNNMFQTIAMNLHKPVSGLPVVGLFGADFLLNYDLMIDIPNKNLSFFRKSGCASPTPLWSGMVHSAHMRITDMPRPRIEIDLLINGKHVDAILDSGAFKTLIPLDDAKRAGVTQAMLDQDQKLEIRGIANTPVPAWLHRFDTIAIGDLVLHNVAMTVAADQDVALLGADFLHSHRVWIPRSGSKFYIQSQTEIPADDPARIKASAP